MLSFFRRVINSRVGVIIAFALLAVIALAFAAGDITGLSGGGGGILGNPVAKVGGTAIGEAEAAKRAQDEIRFARQQQPSFDISQYISAGGVEALVERMTSSLALDQFGHDQGLRVSRALVGSELRSIAAFNGPTGQFDQATYERLIAQRGMSDAQVQREIARDTMSQFLLVPTIGASQVPAQLALPYASLLLERRTGQIALVPVKAIPAGPAPTAAELQQWYRTHVARYTIPERRVLRYALVTADRVRARSAPTDAEIAAAYTKDAARYAAKQTRDATVVTVLNRQAADALAAKVKGGTSLADAARAAGLEARSITGVDRAQAASQTSAAVADALFAGQRGALVGPVAGNIGFVVARLDRITDVPARTLADVRGEIVQALTVQKTGAELQRLQDAIDAALSDNANIGEIVADQKLAVATTPAVLSDGSNPDAPTVRPDPALQPVIAAGFAASDGDSPTLVPVGSDGGFAVVALDRVVAAAAVPLDKVSQQVARDLVADRQQRRARQLADAAVAKLNRGTPLAAALRDTRLTLPPAQPVDTTRAQLNSGQRGPDPALLALFALPQGRARVVPSPQNGGFLIVRTDRIVPGDARRNRGVVDATRADLGRAIGREYAEQFVAAVSADVGVTRNADAIAKLKRDLSGQGGGDR